MNHHRRTLTLLIALVAALLVLPSAAGAASKYVSIKGAKGPGPAELDRVFVEKWGKKNASTVLVLIPGTGGGAGSVAPIARDLSKGVDGLQVWSFDRRGNALEDTSGFESGDPAAAADYYLNFRYDSVSAEEAPFAADWGFKTEMNDLHEVIEEAADGPGKSTRQVILGGHSRGASSVVAYAAWDFKKDGPGHEDLAGLVLIDGGLAAFGDQELTLEEARSGLAEIRAGDVFNDPLGAGIPEAGPIFSELAALTAQKAPDAASTLQDNPIVTAAGLSPPYPVTNEGFLGYLFDKTYSPLGPSLQIRAGDFGPGEPRPWASGENTPIEDFAAAFGREPANATEWYYPTRMVLDTGAANALGRTPAADFLGLRLFHAKRIDVPLYAFQTDLTGGGVLRGAETVIDRSKIDDFKLVDASTTTSHLDPVLAPQASNRFTKTVRPFVRDIVRGPRGRLVSDMFPCDRAAGPIVQQRCSLPAP